MKGGLISFFFQIRLFVGTQLKSEFLNLVLTDFPWTLSNVKRDGMGYHYRLP